MRPFVVIGTPRSRTAWLAEFLTTPARRCEHEPSLRWSGPADLDRWLANDGAAAVDSMMSLVAPAMRQRRPDLFVVAVIRPTEEVVESFRRAGRAGQPWVVDLLAAKARAAKPDILVPYDDLKFDWICEEIFEQCTGEPCDLDRWAALAARNIQSDVTATLRAVLADESRLASILHAYGH